MIPKPSFGPEALTNFDLTLDEVCDELLREYPNLSSTRLREKLARPLVTIAGAGFNYEQTRQLLLRKIRNEWSAARRRWSAMSPNS